MPDSAWSCELASLGGCRASPPFASPCDPSATWRLCCRWLEPRGASWVPDTNVLLPGGCCARARVVERGALRAPRAHDAVTY
jgi:hypothetical protein